MWLIIKHYIILTNFCVSVRAKVSTQKLGLDFLILEKEKQLGGSWAKHYESLKLFSPDVYSSLPDLEFPKVISSYPTKNETVTYLKDYASYFKFPVETEIQVVGISKVNQIFELKSDNNQSFFAKSIVLATGTFSFPYLPNIKGVLVKPRRTLLSENFHTPMDSFHCWLYEAV